MIVTGRLPGFLFLEASVGILCISLWAIIFIGWSNAMLSSYSELRTKTRAVLLAQSVVEEMTLSKRAKKSFNVEDFIVHSSAHRANGLAFLFITVSIFLNKKKPSFSLII